MNRTAQQLSLSYRLTETEGNSNGIVSCELVRIERSPTTTREDRKNDVTVCILYVHDAMSYWDRLI
jgi:hypothetical protein